MIYRDIKKNEILKKKIETKIKSTFRKKEWTDNKKENKKVQEYEMNFEWGMGEQRKKDR